jgi:hypothetical protein
MNVDAFRLNFPEFSDVGDYPSSMITFWSNAGELLLSVERWGDIYNLGLSLFVAHNISLARENKNSAISGGATGQTSGATASKSVGSVSVSYDTAGSMEQSAGHWNQTSYGRQYIRLARNIGIVAIQL